MDRMSEVTFFDQNSVDNFFVEITNIFIYALENGLARIKHIDIAIENKHVHTALRLGLGLIEKGMDPIIIKTILETSNQLVLANNRDVEGVMFELKLLELIIPYIQNSEKQKYLNLVDQLCSMQIRTLLESRLTTTFN